MSESGLVPVRVVFPIGQDSDGYPPYSEEGVWVRPITRGVGEVLSIPFFVVSVSKGDLISYRMEGEQARFSELLSAKGHSTLRLIFFQEDGEGRVSEELKQFGCEAEAGPIQSFLAIDVPPEVDYAAVLDVITRESAMGVLDYEEACVSREHR